MIEDLAEKGEESTYYKKGYSQGPNKQRDKSMDSLVFQNRNFGTEWALEIFNGKMPTKDSIHLDPNHGIYFGTGIGKYEYAAVLNIKDAYKGTDSTNIDHDFENGEKSHAEKGTDGTILYHTKDLIGEGGLTVKGTAGTYSAAIYDVSKVKILGRLDNGKFVTDL